MILYVLLWLHNFYYKILKKKITRLKHAKVEKPTVKPRKRANASLTSA